MRYFLSFLITLSVICAGSALATWLVFINSWLAGLVFLVTAFAGSFLNIWFADRNQHKLAFGQSGIGQRDDYDSDIRSPAITKMRNDTRAADIDKATKILRDAGLM